MRDRAHESLELATGKHLPADTKGLDDALHHNGSPQGATGTIAEEPTKNRNLLGWR